MSESDTVDTSEAEDTSSTESSSDTRDTTRDTSTSGDTSQAPDAKQPDGDDDHGASEQDLVDRSAVDFDPDDGLYAGTAVDGSTNIPGAHPDLDELGVDYETDELDGADEQGESKDGGADARTDSSGGGRHRPLPGPGTSD